MLQAWCTDLAILAFPLSSFLKI
uniref:Uncharacterized protein n=1 Tax=Anguilla anguilla TaxID=7936 RepID=A0A0E9T0E2_ANGAN